MTRKILFRQNRRHGLDALATKLLLALTLRRSRRLAEAQRHRIIIPAFDYIGNHINTWGVFEKEQLETVFAFLAPLADAFRQGRALDIGANIGNHTLFFADRFANIHCFEPNPSACYLLEYNVRPFPNVVVHRFGLGDQAGSFTLYERIGSLGEASLLPSRSESTMEIAVEIRRLDDLQIDLDTLVLIKIDVDGFEGNVLAGAERAIETHQPVIVFEQLAETFDGDASPAISFLSDRSYRICWYEGDGDGAGSWLSRRLRNVYEIAMGRNHKIVCGDRVPRADHAMLIGVPPRFQSILLPGMR